jgi:hypothetical protein
VKPVGATQHDSRPPKRWYLFPFFVKFAQINLNCKNKKRRVGEELMPKNSSNPSQIFLAFHCRASLRGRPLATPTHHRPTDWPKPRNRALVPFFCLFVCSIPVFVFSRLFLFFWIRNNILFSLSSQQTVEEPKGLQNLHQHRQTEPTNQESAVAPGRAAASLGGTTTSSTTARADPGRTATTRCSCPSLAADLGNSKKAPQRGTTRRRSPPEIL